MSVPEKKNVQTCAQRMGGGSGKGGGSIMRRVLDGEHETESDCWRICVHLNPERKGDQFDSFFFFFQSVRPQQHPLCPLPTPLALSLTLQSSRLVVVVREWVSGGWGVGLDTPGGNISGGFVSMRTVLICYLACTHARKHAR